MMDELLIHILISTAVTLGIEIIPYPLAASSPLLY